MVRGSGPKADDRYVLAFVAAQGTFSETAISLANKLAVDSRVTRRVLISLLQAGYLERRTFDQRIEPVYYHFSQVEGRRTTRSAG